MTKLPERFLIDANALITPYESYYPFDFAESFWTQISEHIKTGSIVLLDMVKAEIMAGNDDLSKWMGALEIGAYIDHREPAIIQRYAEVLEYVKANPCYRPSALHEWSKNTVADAWIIASAAEKSLTVITFEPSNSGLNSRFPSKEAKIPDVCSAFSVEAKNLYYMMRSLGIRMQ